MPQVNNKLNWFFCLNENRAGAFLDMAKVAVLSAAEYDFNKYCIYDGDNAEFVAFLEQNDVRVIFHESSFKEKITEMVDKIAHPTFYGAFLRVDIPLIIEKLQLPITQYLYTDCDVIFINDPTEYLYSLTPKYLAATGEYTRDDTKMFNSGVMWCNTEAMRASYKDFYNLVISKNFKFVATDQGALNEFYTHEKMCDEINWKPYWGVNERAYLVHFHGPKPYHFKIYLNEGKKLTNPHIRGYGSFLNESNEEKYKHYLKLYNNFLRQTY